MYTRCHLLSDVRALGGAGEQQAEGAPGPSGRRNEGVRDASAGDGTPGRV
jgi:hypothetical protein